MTTATPAATITVCAVLVQNPLNLGGLCRTCEALGADRLVLSDLRLAQVWAFRQLAASTHRWQHLEACQPDQLAPWLKQQPQRRVALTVRGSCALSSYRFAAQTVLVLGSELTGIPPAVSVLCEDEVAIPQCGQVESLNVQTAAAIALYEYRRQHPK